MSEIMESMPPAESPQVEPRSVEGDLTAAPTRQRYVIDDRPNHLKRYAVGTATVLLLGTVGVGANVLYDYYHVEAPPMYAEQSAGPSQPSESIVPNVLPSAMPEDLYDLNKAYHQGRQVELSREERIKAVAELPIQPVEASTPLHITLETPARTADQLSEEARQEFPDGVPSVTINVPLGPTDGELTGTKNSQGQDAYIIEPPHNAEGYYWTQKGTTLGVSRPNPEDPAHIDLPDDNQVEIYGHANSQPNGEPLAFQDLKYAQKGDTFTIQTEKGVLTYKVEERQTPKKKLGAIDDPILANPMSGQVVLVACLQDPKATHSTYAVVLRAVLVASHPNS